MSKLTPDAYPVVLGALLSGNFPWKGSQIDVLICGMAGAKQGWMEAPYLDAPADLETLADRAVVPAMPDARVSARILPGICQRATSQEDVMRGEETQLLGLGTLWPGFSGVVCMPGTHSKWVQLTGRRAERFTTAMTGELFEIGAPIPSCAIPLPVQYKVPNTTTGSRPDLAPASKRRKSCQSCSSRFARARFSLAGHPIGVRGFFRAYSSAQRLAHYANGSAKPKLPSSAMPHWPNSMPGGLRSLAAKPESLTVSRPPWPG